MVLWHISIILSLFPIFVHLSYENKEDNSVMKQKVNNITNKIDKLARDIEAHSSLDEKYHLLNSIEKKLLKAAKHLGRKGENHVELIMQGIKLKAFNGSRETTNNSHEATVDNEKVLSLDKDQSINTKKIDNLATKIDMLIVNELNGLQTAFNKHKLLEIIKDRMLESVNEKQKEIRQNNINHIIESNYTRRVNLRGSNEAEVRSDSDNYGKSIVDKMHDDVRDSNTSFRSVTFSPMCQEISDRTCLQIKSMNSLKCLYDDIIVPLDKLCNGIVDCPDKSDEQYCGSQAMERMQYSNWVITNIESHLKHNNCFETGDSKINSSKRNQIIQNVLQMREEFREKYKNPFPNNNLILKKDSNEENVKVKSNEIAVIISSFAQALEGALCSYISDELQTRIKTYTFENELDKVMLKAFSWAPKDCKCNREYCTNCTNACKRICRHQNSLTSWNCESIQGTDTVSLNSLCDGKLDCLDESDENDCMKGSGYEKFEAHEIYSNVLKMLKLKASKESLLTQKSMLNLWNFISKLQQLSTKYVADKTSIKALRNKCYSLIRTIYSDKLKQLYTDNESEEMYLFLLSVNENLGAALKRSHTGNSKIIADGCYCRSGLCATTICSKVCVKACAVEPKLMRFNCKHDSSLTVSLDEVCNNKTDCPSGFDELNCKKDEICRRHHLIVLRHNLQEIGENLKGTALGELLISWKTKVISTIKVAEKNRAPRPRVIKNIVKDILRDLLVTYGTVEEYRRSNTDYALPEFLRIAQIIMETLKSCGK